jgi:hypothetical protein
MQGVRYPTGNDMKSHLEIAGLICALCLFAGVLRWSVNDSTVFGEDTEESDVLPEGYVQGEPIYEQLRRDDESLICCYEYGTSLCGSLLYGGRRHCDDSPFDPPRAAVGNPYTHELRVIEGCPTYVAVGPSSCQEGVDPRP